MTWKIPRKQTYGLANGARLKGKPQIVGEALEDIRKGHNGRLLPVDVVSEAKSKDSPLHGEFEWNNTSAAHEYRLVQARSIIRAVVVITGPKTEKPNATRAFVNVVPNGGSENFYDHVHVALSDPGYRSQLREEAIRDLEGFQRKYKAIEELAELMGVIDDNLELLLGVVNGSTMGEMAG